MEAWPEISVAQGIRARQPNALQLELRRSPLLTVTSVKYYPKDGSAQATLAAANYRVSTNSTPGFIEFVDTASFPELATRFDAVEVAFTSGHGTTESAVPGTLRQAVLLLARHYYDNRLPIGDVKFVELPLSLRNILRGQRVESLVAIQK